MEYHIANDPGLQALFEIIKVLGALGLVAFALFWVGALLYHYVLPMLILVGPTILFASIGGYVGFQMFMGVGAILGVALGIAAGVFTTKKISDSL